MGLIHTVFIEIGGRTIRYTPPQRMDMMEIFSRFYSKDSRPIVTSSGDGTARVSMVPDLKGVIEEIGEFIL